MKGMDHVNVNTVLSGILGLAVGDALGVPVEFRSREALDRNPVTGMRAFGTHNQPAGTWSDDTSMALCLMESLCGGLDWEDMMGRFQRWGETGYMTPYGRVFDMGGATQRALAEYGRGKPALECGGRRESDNGNGSLMRILPLAFYLRETMGPDFPQRPEAYSVLHRASAVTHAHPISKISCGVYCAAANALMEGGDVWEGIAAARSFYCARPEYAKVWKARFERIDSGILAAVPREDVKSSGFVVDTLEAALWCLLKSGDFASCLLTAVNLGDDTDTVGAVAGGLAGIRFGMDGIPAAWLETLAKRKEIEALCRRFWESLG